MQRIRALGGGIFVVALVFIVLWLLIIVGDLLPAPLSELAKYKELALTIVVSIGFLALMGFLAWVGWTMATLKVEIPEIEEVEAPKPEEVVEVKPEQKPPEQKSQT